METTERSTLVNKSKIMQSSLIVVITINTSQYYPQWVPYYMLLWKVIAMAFTVRPMQVERKKKEEWIIWSDGNWGRKVIKELDDGDGEDDDDDDWRVRKKENWV